jgi:hypothetical protein
VSRLIWSLDSYSYGCEMSKGTALRTGDYLHPLDLGAAQIHDMGRCGIQGPRFEPEHLIDPVVLIQRHSMRYDDLITRTYLTFRSETSVTRLRGPAREGSSTRVFAPFTYAFTVNNTRRHPGKRTSLPSSMHRPSRVVQAI